jgi:hypothetical protein
MEFVGWPSGAFLAADSPLVVGVMAETSLANELQQLSAEPVKGRKLVVRRFKGALEFRGEETPGRRQDDLVARRARKIQELRSCHVLFVSRTEQGYLPLILKPLKGESILTIGESPVFIRHGGIINLADDDGRLQFEVDLDAAKAARLTISSKLLQLARAVHTGNHDTDN